jgi:hypothetical protein
MPAYATVEDLRAYLDQVDDEAATTALLQECLDRGRSLIDTALGWSFLDAGASWPAASVKKVQAEASQWLRLHPYQQGSITSLTVAGDTAAIADYEEDWDAGLFYLWREDGWAGLRYAVTAKYSYGPAPDAIVQLNLEAAVNIWRTKTKGMFTEVQGAEGGGQTQIRYIGGLTRQQQAVIDAVRRPYRDVAY